MAGKTPPEQRIPDRAGRADDTLGGTMACVDLTPLISTVAGAGIAISGTFVADLLRRRDSRHRYSYGERQRSYVEMVLALGGALEALRAVASADIPRERLYTATSAAVSKAGVYVAREKLLMAAAPKVAQAAESAFNLLIGVRDAVREGARLRTPAFHDAYHPYAEEMWRLRLAIREDLNAPGLAATDLDREAWSGRATCALCNPPALATTKDVDTASAARS
jgi:hypothetical protein